MKKRQYLGTYKYSKEGIVYPSHPAKLTRFTRSGKSVNKALGNRNVAIRDFRPNLNTYDLDQIKKDLTEVGALKQCGFDKLRKMLYRVFLNPNRKIQNYLKAFKQKYYRQDTHVLGVQVRLGGCMANQQEIMALMTRREFESIPGKISNLIRSLSNPVVYLSTDSDYAEKYLRERLPNVTILTSSQYFTRGHSTWISPVSIVEAALVDLFLLADTDLFLYQSASGFGRVAVELSRAKTMIPMKVSHYKVHYNSTSCIQKF